MSQRRSALADSVQAQIELRVAELTQQIRQRMDDRLAALANLRNADRTAEEKDQSIAATVANLRPAGA